MRWVASEHRRRQRPRRVGGGGKVGGCAEELGGVEFALSRRGAARGPRGVWPLGATRVGGARWRSFWVVRGCHGPAARELHLNADRRFLGHLIFAVVRGCGGVNDDLQPEKEAGGP